MIEGNIVFGVLDVIMEDVWCMVWIVDVDYFIEIMFESYDMIVGECGVGFFGG